jgi:hypothetical protein
MPLPFYTIHTFLIVTFGNKLFIMKLVTYLKDGHDQLALLVNSSLYDTDSLHPDLPISMAMFLNYWEDVFPVTKAAEKNIIAGLGRSIAAIPFETANLLAPVQQLQGWICLSPACGSSKAQQESRHGSRI